jgi:hypothetical protein
LIIGHQLGSFETSVIFEREFSVSGGVDGHITAAFFLDILLLGATCVGIMEMNVHFRLKALD